MKNVLSTIFNSRTLYKIFSFENLVPVVLLSFVTWYISYINGFITIYNDAMSHLNISRMVIDNLEPGLAQLGGVWLPITHILPIALIWNDWAWHSGFAGSFFSMVAYVVSVWAIYKSLFIITKKQLAAIIGSLVFAFNLNMLYLQTTPMTEPIYIALFCLSALVFTHYLTKTDNTKYLLLLGILGFFQVLTRYDGWFVVVFEAMLIGVYELFILRNTFSVLVGKFFLFGTPIAFGIGLWLLWNQLIFGHPFFFAFGPYSAHSQQLIYEGRGELATKGNFLNSIVTYGYAMLHNVGIYMTALAAVGAGFFLIAKRTAMQFSNKLLFILFLSTPIVFNILALFLGFSIIFTPAINLTHEISQNAEWFNIRYGLLALPLIAVLAGLFASWRKLAIVIVMQIIVLQTLVTYSTGIVTLIDGHSGKSSFYAGDIAAELEKGVQPDDKVLLPIYSFSPAVFKSGIRMDQIIHEGVSKQWPFALQKPEEYVDWIVMMNDASDPIYKSLIIDRKEAFLQHYERVYVDNSTSIYKKKQNT